MMKYLVINIILALLPAAILIAVLAGGQKNRKPVQAIWLTFVLGFFAVLPVLAVEIGIDDLYTEIPHPWSPLARAFLVAGLTEEGLKAVTVYFLGRRRGWVQRPIELMEYAMIAGIGFAVFESLLFSFGSPATVLLRGATAVPLHVTASGIAGLGIGKAFFTLRAPAPSPEGRHTPFFRLVLPWFCGAVLLHGLYDFLLFTGGGVAFLAIPVLLAAVFVLKRLYDIEKHRRITDNG